MKAMNLLEFSRDSSRTPRQRRPLAALVERLERRALLTLRVDPITTAAGQYYYNQIASFAAGDVQGTLADYQATIYWPGSLDGTTSGYIAPNGPGNYVIYSDNVYAKPGTYPINVVLTGAKNSTAQASGTVTVTDAPLSATATTILPARQTLFSGAVASFSTTNGYAISSDFQAVINWGDGVNTQSPGAVNSIGYGTFSVVGSNTYQNPGTFPITVTILSPGGQTNIVNSTAIVSALPVSLLPNPVSGNAGQPLSGVTVATMLDPYPSDPTSDFQATIAWGDGTVDVGTLVVQGNGVYRITGDHAYAAPGSYAVTTQVTRLATQQTASIGTTAQIGSPSPTYAFTGGLASVYSNGPYVARGIATTRTPVFSGTAAAYALVQLFAQPLNSNKQVYLGETVADAGGNWSLPTGRIAPGTYVVTAKVTPPSGYPGQMIVLTSNEGTFSIGLSPARAKSASHHRSVVSAHRLTSTRHERPASRLLRRGPNEA